MPLMGAGSLSRSSPISDIPRGMTAIPDPAPEAPGVLDVLVANHRQFLAFLERRTGSRADAEDLLQDAFAKGLARGHQVNDPESAVAWFYRVLRNALTDWYRRRGAEDRALAQWGGREDVAEAPKDEEMFGEVCGCVDRLAATLRPEYAEALRRVDVEEMPVKEFAAAAGITPGNAGVRLHRAREALRARVIQSCGTCADHGCLDCGCRTTSSR
jgi:RNA polymerase sigma-70 factor (ECF subfamily)